MSDMNALRQMMKKLPLRAITLLHEGISEPVLYGDLVYKFERVNGKPCFSDQLKR